MKRKETDFLEKLHLPKDIKTIDEDCFTCCSSLTTINLPKHLSPMKHQFITTSNNICEYHEPICISNNDHYQSIETKYSYPNRYYKSLITIH